MIISLFIFLVLNSAFYYYRKSKGIPTNVLCCGLFGGQAVEGKTLSELYLAILGAYNVQRGEHSCGYYYNGNIRKGVGDEALITQVIHNDKGFIKGDLPCNVFIGHTRQATKGHHTIANSHPFQYGNYVQSHNGTIKNIWSLEQKYKVKAQDVDSQSLALIIKQEGFEPLNYYKGGAALAFTYTDDCNTLYLYHGASREYRNGEIKGERPLFYVELEGGLYYSSLAQALSLIAGNKEIKELQWNVVKKVQNGRLINDWEYYVPREDTNIDNYSSESTTIISGYLPFGEIKKPEPGLVLPLNKHAEPWMFAHEKYSSLLCESLPPEAQLYDVYYQQGRYFRSVVGENNVLMHGIYNIDKFGDISIMEVKKKTTKYYFIKGIMLKNQQAFDTLWNMRSIHSGDAESLNFACFCGKESMYPITCLFGEGEHSTTKSLNRWYFGIAMCPTKHFTPLFSSRTYYIKDAWFKNMNGAFANEKCFYDWLSPDIVTQYKLDGIEVIEQKKQEIFNDEEKWRDGLIREIEDCFDRKITKKNYQKLPEAFYLCIDEYVSLYLESTGNKPGHKEISEETNNVIKDLVKTGLTMHQYILDAGDNDITYEFLLDEVLRYYEQDYEKDWPHRFDKIDIFQENVEETPEKLLDIEQELNYEILDPIAAVDEMMVDSENQRIKILVNKAVDQIADLHLIANELESIRSNEAAMGISVATHGAIYKITQEIEEQSKTHAFLNGIFN